MAVEQTIDVNIFGGSYTLSAESDEQKKHIRMIAEQVDARMQELSMKLSLTSIPKIAILTALNLANDLTKSVNNIEEIKKPSVDESQIDRLIKKIDLCI